jgi:hypothetical protein
MLKIHTGERRSAASQLPVDLTALSPIQVFERAARFWGGSGQLVRPCSLERLSLR